MYMEKLVKDLWKIEDLNDLYQIYENLKNPDKVAWERNIVNTDYSLFAIKSNDTKNISKYIYMGNYLSFLDIMPHKYYEDTIIDAYLISKIKDFKMQKKYINKLLKYIDNWSTADTLKYSTKHNEEEYLKYSGELISSPKTYYKRVGVRILFNYLNDDTYLDRVFELVSRLKDSEEYYVNMVNAWFICEAFIKQRDRTLEFMKSGKINKFTLNKAISKCHDSYRVSKKDKEYLNGMRIK